MRKMKVLLIVITTISVLFSLSVLVTAGMKNDEENKKSISEMTEIECYQTLLEHGLVVPEIYEGESEELMAACVKGMADATIKNEGMPKVINYPPGAVLAARVSKVVIEYEGIQVSDELKEELDMWSNLME